MTLKGGTSQACAACKYQRRKCTPDCELAPYFPPDQPKMFQNAHKLFGVSNILKILKQLDPSQKMIAMQSIIYQSNIRDRFPVHGCLGIICQLRYQILQAEEELHAVHTQLALYRQHEISSSSGSASISVPNDSNNMQLNLFNQTNYTALPMNSHISYANSGYNNGHGDNNNNNNLMNTLWGQQQGEYCNGNDDNTIAMQCQLEQLTVQEDAPTVQEYDEIHPFFDIDERQDAYESSSESQVKDTTQSLELTLLRTN